MKKFGFLLPILAVLVFSFVSTRMLSNGSINPLSMIGISAFLFALIFLLRPKKSAAKPVVDLENQILGEYAKNAFTDDPQLAAKFQAALKDYRGSAPKAALNKLQKLAPQCNGDKQIYAVSMAAALCMVTVGKHREAIREYIRALGIHPTSEIAMELGSCYQRQGELEKAQDSYQYAIDLEPENLSARCKLATAYVADGRYSMGLEQAMLVLEKDERNDSALATAAICYGLTNEPFLYKRYTDLAVDNGYKRDKITNTVDALKKRK